MGTRRKKAKRVLIVDDDPHVQTVLKLLLGSAGIEALPALTGTEALEMMPHAKPDLVLLDLMMPEKTGWEVAGEMRSNPDLAEIPIIVLTAKGNSVDRNAMAQAVKVEGYVAKPFEPEDLLKTISKVLTQRSS